MAPQLIFTETATPPNPNPGSVALYAGLDGNLYILDPASGPFEILTTAGGGTLSIASGGTGQTTKQAAFDALSPLGTAGDTLYYNGTHNVALPIGTTGQVLTVVAGEPAWAASGSGGALTATYVGYGSVSNTLTGTSDFIWLEASKMFGVGATSSIFAAAGTDIVAINGSSHSIIDMQIGGTAVGYLYAVSATELRLGNIATGGILSFNTANTVMTMSAAGNVVILAPASGVALTVTAASGQPGVATTSSFYSEATGQVQLALNSVGTYYGTINNSSSQVWSLGYSASPVTLGTDVLTWYPSGNVTITGTVTAPTFSGALSGNASTATSATTAGTATTATNVTATNNASSGPYDVAFLSSPTGAVGILSNASLYYNPNTGTLNATILNATSDRRLKKNITKIDNALAIIESLNGVRFDWIDNDMPSAGLIAQDVQAVMPELVTNNEKRDMLGLNYNGIVGALVEAVKDLSAQVTALKAEVAELKAK